MNKIQKHFPADTTLDEITFLNDSKVDAELYGYLLSQSYPDEETKETRVKKAMLPSQEVIGRDILKSSRRTVINHLNYLKEKGYIIDTKEFYILQQPERMFFQMPLELLDFFIDTLKQPVLKTYIYLGQRYSYKPKEYVFTIKEIAEHLGLNYQRSSSSIRNYLTVLENLSLIKITHFYEGQTPLMRLVGFSTQRPQLCKNV